MKTEDYEYLYKLEENFWWFAGMREITATLLDPFLPDRDRLILDAGCGTGGNLEWLARYAGNGSVVGIDLVATALKFCQSRDHRLLAQASATDLPFPDGVFDLATSFDVLGQIPGEGADEQAILDMYRVLRPGGIAFVRAAAYEWMRSGHDEALGTHRRYRLDQLCHAMQRAGFRIARATYANSLLLPVAALRRLIFKRIGLADRGSDVKPLPPQWNWLNRVLTTAIHGEACRLQNQKAKLPAGLSIICVAEKPTEESRGVGESRSRESGSQGVLD